MVDKVLLLLIFIIINPIHAMELTNDLVDYTLRHQLGMNQTELNELRDVKIEDIGAVSRFVFDVPVYEASVLTRNRKNDYKITAEQRLGVGITCRLDFWNNKEDARHLVRIHDKYFAILKEKYEAQENKKSNI